VSVKEWRQGKAALPSNNRTERVFTAGGCQVTEIIFLVEEAPEGGFTARALGASIFTEADGLESLEEAVRDAVRCHFDDGEQSSVEIDRPAFMLSSRNEPSTHE
jgi:hypothetical protein